MLFFSATTRGARRYSQRVLKTAEDPIFLIFILMDAKQSLLNPCLTFYLPIAHRGDRVLFFLLVSLTLLGLVMVTRVGLTALRTSHLQFDTRHLHLESLESRPIHSPPRILRLEAFVLHLLDAAQQEQRSKAGVQSAEW